MAHDLAREMKFCLMSQLRAIVQYSPDAEAREAAKAEIKRRNEASDAERVRHG